MEFYILNIYRILHMNVMEQLNGFREFDYKDEREKRPLNRLDKIKTHQV